MHCDRIFNRISIISRTTTRFDESKRGIEALRREIRIPHFQVNFRYPSQSKILPYFLDQPPPNPSLLEFCRHANRLQFGLGRHQTSDRKSDCLA